MVKMFFQFTQIKLFVLHLTAALVMIERTTVFLARNVAQTLCLAKLYSCTCELVWIVSWQFL